MTTQTAPDGTRWANDCDLCRGERKVGVGVAFSWNDAPECPWCKSVRMKYGNYWYPIDKSNEHLFRDAPASS